MQLIRILLITFKKKRTIQNKIEKKKSSMATLLVKTLLNSNSNRMAYVLFKWKKKHFKL